MLVELVESSRVLVDLRATGLLRAVGHNPTMVATPQPFSMDVEGSSLDVPLVVRFVTETIEVPRDLSPSDRDKMRENMLGRDVLDAARHPAIEFRGRYTGTFDAGALAGDVQLRGIVRSIRMPITVHREGEDLAASGVWEGKLRDLGIKPFKALLGALKLDDWARVRVSVRFRPASPSR